MKKIMLWIVIFLQIIALSQITFAVPQNDFDPDGLFFFIENNKYGYMDSNGKTVLPAKYPIAENFYDGLGMVSIDKKTYGYINKSGAFVLKPKYYFGSYFSEGVAYVVIQEGKQRKWYIVNKTGKLFPIPDFGFKQNFQEGLARVMTKDDKWGFIDKSGKYIVEPQYESAGDFSEGLASVMVNKRWGFINKRGEMVIQPQFTSISAMYFSNGFTAVRYPQNRKNGLYQIGFIDKKGILQNTDWLKKMDEEVTYGINNISGPCEGVSIVGTNEYYYALIDPSGKILMNFRQIELMYDFHNDLAAFQEYTTDRKGKWGFINKQGEVVIKPQYDTVSSFCKSGIAQFFHKEGNLFINGYINKKGKIVRKWTIKDE